MTELIHLNEPYVPDEEEIAAMIAEQDALEQAAHDAMVDDIAQRVVEILIANTNIKLTE